MKKNLAAWIFVALSALSAGANRHEEVTLVMVPREDSVVQVGMDIANHFPTLLISYKVGANGSVSLHGWNGTEWVNITTKDFLAGDFFRTGPDSALIVEDEGTMLPDTMLPPEEWCSAVYKITTTEIRALIHLVGQYYDFSFKDWQWFSTNYKMSLDAINPEGLNVAWYHKRLSDNMKSSPVAADDLQYWMAVRHPEPVVPVMEEPVVETVDTNVVETVESMGATEETLANPLTNDVPAAVVMGADTAEEAETNLVETAGQQ